MVPCQKLYLAKLKMYVIGIKPEKIGFVILCMDLVIRPTFIVSGKNLI